MVFPLHKHPPFYSLKVFKPSTIKSDASLKAFKNSLCAKYWKSLVPNDTIAN